MNEPTPEEIASALPSKRARARKDDATKLYSPDPHRLLPQSPDGEKGILSSLLIHPKEIAPLCAERGVTREHFAIPAHGMIYERIMRMSDRDEKIDFITLGQSLKDDNLLDICGGNAYTTDLFTFLPTAANADHYIEIVTEKYLLREAIKVATEYAGRAYDEQADPDGLVERFEQSVFAIRNRRIARANKSARQLVVEAITQVQEVYDRRGSISGISTGFSRLDHITDGMHGAEMIVLAARPSMGKTALAMNIAEHVCVDLGKSVAVFSLEMTATQLMTRMLCSRAHVNLARVRDGHLAERDFPALQVAASALSDAGLHIDDSSGLTIQELRGRARRMKQQHDIAAVFVDYLQLVKSTSKQSQENRQQEVAEVSGGMKAMAKELNVPVIVLCQIGRDFDRRATGGVAPRPRMSDLRESGAIEQDADLIAFLTRDEFYAENDEQRDELSGQATLTIAKQRNGPLGDVPLTFLKEFTRFETRAEYREEPSEQQPTFRELPLVDRRAGPDQL